MDYTCRYTRAERPNLYYGIENPHTGKIVWPKETRVWAFSEPEHKNNAAENRIWWGKKGKNKVPALKNFADEIQQGMVPTSLLLHEDVGHTDEAAKELRSLLPNVKRDSKPIRLIRHLMRMGCDLNGLVLFPFGGAGEGPHAVLEANTFESIDGTHANRRFVAISEQDADSIVAERIRRAIAGGLQGSFEYCTLGPAVDADTLLEQETLPTFEALARYVFRTATGRSLEAVDETNSNWRIGQTETTDIHLVYKPDLPFLRSNEAMLDDRLARSIVEARESNRTTVIFASGKFLPQRELASLGIEFCPFPVSLYRIAGA